MPKRYAIARANRWMVSWVDHLISYADNPAGNSRKLVEWGKHRMERGQLRCEDLYEAETLLLKPRNLCPEKTVLLTSCDDTVVPHRDDVEQAVLELIFDEFWVMILDLTTPFGQSAMEILLEQKRSRRSYVICGAAGRPAGQRKNIRDQYATETGYIGLCAMADCEYFRYNPGEVETSAGFVCSESGRISMKEAKELFHSALFSRGNMCYNLKQ